MYRGGEGSQISDPALARREEESSNLVLTSVVCFVMQMALITAA